MKRRSLLILTIIVSLLASTSMIFAAGEVESTSDTSQSLSVLVYITGVMAGSPPYTALAEGAQEFAAQNEAVTVKIYEAGFNQAEWEEQLTSLVATGEYDIVLGSNPSLPEICERVGKKFPKQKFIITDAFYEGNDQIRTYLYNQYEQSLFLGYLAGLVTTSSMEYANSALKIGFIAAQEYPLLNKHMVPGFLEGARMVNPGIELDFRIVGNWFDANKAADLASSMRSAGVDVFASIAGGAAQGLFKVAQEQGAYIVFHNTNEYKAAPGRVVGCGSMEQKKLVKEILSDVMAGNVTYGDASIVGVQEGYIGFFYDDPAYAQNLPSDIRKQFESFMGDVSAGKIAYTLPKL
ncbi:MAG: BMP family ABC transporter substrate-binding protein [Sphaerochaeta sp.]|jgi:simple sugar transport system substrate-binding protein|uniref:BMP family ABC transporter substrate-binding protein n=1 Tax=Sphaerochaeta sp. TaxID=1972642 RepID=UPI002A36E4DB|nr:BMP family ABC transporter substrate-binding protein [Sphaerochaeta sp.]MDX9824681.1 BMP family ABC transporter substrate-binding protein [Sphaerochaeta sp.]